MKNINSEIMENEIKREIIDYKKYFNTYGMENTIAVAVDLINDASCEEDDWFNFEYACLKRMFNTIRERKENETEFEYVKNICKENNLKYITEDDEPYSDPIIIIGDTEFDLYDNDNFICTINTEMPIAFDYKGNFMYLS